MVVSKLDFEIAKGKSFKVRIDKMQDELHSEYIPHTVCSSDMYKIARKNICTNPNCKFHTEFPSSDDTKRTFEKLKNGEQAQETFEKEHIDNCKKLDSMTFKVLGSEPKDFDRTRIMGCAYVNPISVKGIHYQGYCLLWSALQGEQAISVSHARTGTEKLGILTVENGIMYLYDVAHTEQIREPKFDSSKIDVSVKTIGIAKAWIESLKPFDISVIESQTTKNFENLANGKPITTEIQEIKEEIEAEELFAVETNDKELVEEN